MGPRTSGFILLALAAVGYTLAARAVAPGFYDGIAPPQDYRWACPPPELRAGNQQPLAGRAAVKVGGNGVVDPGSVFTPDGQAALSFVPGAFATPADRSPVTIEIEPRAACSSPSGFRLATNVYCFTSSSPLVPGQSPLVTLVFSTQAAAPSDVYQMDAGGAWRKLGSTGAAAPYSIATRISSLGCFAGGYAPDSARKAGSGGSILPVVAGLAVAVVVLAGIPLLVLRRRGQDGGGEER